MATLVQTYGFSSNAQGFTFTGSGTGSWVSSNSGSLQSTISGKNKTATNDLWSLTTTWAALGIPSTATITGVTSASMQSQCTAFTTGGSSHTSGAATLVDGTTTITLSAQRSFTTTDASPVTTNGTNLTGLSLAATDSITINIPNAISTGNSVSAVMTLLQDELTFTITYTVPPTVITAAQKDWFWNKSTALLNFKFIGNQKDWLWQKNIPILTFVNIIAGIQDHWLWKKNIPLLNSKIIGSIKEFIWSPKVALLKFTLSFNNPKEFRFSKQIPTFTFGGQVQIVFHLIARYSKYILRWCKYLKWEVYRKEDD